MAGSNISTVLVALPVPGPTTSSRFAPENASTWPVGSAMAVEYQRESLRLAVAVVVTELPAAVSTVVIALVGIAT